MGNCKKLMAAIISAIMVTSSVGVCPKEVFADTELTQYEFTSGTEDEFPNTNDIQSSVSGISSSDTCPARQNDVIFSDCFDGKDESTNVIEAEGEPADAVFEDLDEGIGESVNGTDIENRRSDAAVSDDFQEVNEQNKMEFLTDGIEEAEIDDLQLTASNTTYDNATNIGVNVTYKDKSITNEDTNWYKFTVSKNGFISLAFGKEYESNKNRFWNVKLYNTSQEEIISRTIYCGTTATENFCKVGVSAGTYYIKVAPGYYYWSDVTYSLKVNYTSSSVWETEFNDSVDTADLLKTGTTYYASSCENDDVDYYKVSIAKNGYISLAFGKEYESNKDCFWNIKLYNASQSEIMSRTVYCGTAAKENFCKVGLSAGTYYIKVEPGYYYWSAVTYSLKVNHTPSDVWETEFNDSVDTANSLKTGTTYYASSCENDDVDYYKVSIAKNGYIGLSFGKGYESNKDCFWNVKLYNTSQKEIMSRTVYCGSTATENFCKVGVPAGTYYIKVEPGYYYWSDVTYSLKVNHTSSGLWEKEFNDSADTANPLKTGTTYYANSRENDDVDYYKVSVAKKGYICLSFGKNYETNKECFWNVRLYNMSQKEIVSRTVYCGTTTTDNICKVGVPAGTYYIKVEPGYYYWSDVTYSLKVNYASSGVWETELNDSIDTADALKIGTTYYGNSCRNDDVDYYSVDIPSSGYLSLSLKKAYDSNQSHRWYVKVIDSSYKEVMNYTFYCGDVKSEVTGKIAVSAGKYYIKIMPEYYDWSDVTYGFAVNLNLATPVIYATSNVSSGINIKWGKIRGATGYYIYRKIGSGAWSKIKTVTSGSSITYTDTSAKNKNGTTYYYIVYAFNSKIRSTGSQYKKIVRMTTPTFLSLKNIASKKMTVKWDKNSQASGYLVQYSVSKMFSSGNKSVIISGKSSATATITGLTKGKTYYVRVRSYKTVNGVKYYSAWGPVKSVKISK